MSAAQAQETGMDDLPQANYLMDQIPCPRFTFTWPGLTLESHSLAAGDFLPLKEDSAVAPINSSQPTLRFDQIFRPPERAPKDQRQWVDELVQEAATAEFGRNQILQPFHFHHPCTSTMFLTPNKDQPKALQVLLLSPVVPTAAQRPKLAEQRPRSSERPTGGHAEGGEPPRESRMSKEEAFAMLDKVTGRTHDQTTGRKHLSEEELRYLVDELPEMAFIANLQGEVVWLNRRYYEYTGLSHAETLNWRETYHPEDMPHALSVWSNGILTATPFTFEFRIKGHADGRYRWFLCKAKPCWNEQGQIKHWASTITDVEELVNARHEAVAVKNHIQTILSSSRTIVISVDSELGITFFEGSPYEAAALPIEPGTLLQGRKLEDTWPDPELITAIKDIFDNKLGDTTIRTAITRDRKKHWYRYKLTPLMGDRRKGQEEGKIVGVSAVGANVTEMVEAEDRLRAVEVEKAQLIANEVAAKEASRLKTEYFTHISHETRTPVAGIISIAELLLADDTLQDEHRLLVSQALRSGEILLELVGMVLDLRKVESGELKLERAPFTLADVMDDAKLFAVIAKKKGLAFHEQVDGLHQGALLGDRMRLRQVLANGLSNAAKFTDEGSITLRAEQLSETATQVVVRFTIADTGCGISPAVLPKLFTPFRQADESTARRYGGTGLGLVISREFVTLMGGKVELESTEGEGTTMLVTVPLEKDRRTGAEREADRKLAMPPLRFGAGSAEDRDAAVDEFKKRRDPRSVRILVAEDNELLRELTVKTLHKMNFEVVAVGDGETAVEEVRKGRYDLVLMDGQMPVKDGYTATREIRADPDPRIAQMRIIALTASAFRGDRERCLESGMSHYISKPVRARDLEQAVWDQLVDQEAVAADKAKAKARGKPNGREDEFNPALPSLTEGKEGGER